MDGSSNEGAREGSGVSFFCFFAQQLIFHVLRNLQAKILIHRTITPKVMRSSQHGGEEENMKPVLNVALCSSRG